MIILTEIHNSEGGILFWENILLLKEIVTEEKNLYTFHVCP